MALSTHNLQEALSESGKSMADIAREMGVSKSTVGRWFTGEREPETVERLQELADRLHVTIGFLAGEDEMPKNALEKRLLAAGRQVDAAYLEQVIALLEASKRSS